jgi:hypothetical protein
MDNLTVMTALMKTNAHYQNVMQMSSSVGLECALTSVLDAMENWTVVTLMMNLMKRDVLSATISETSIAVTLVRVNASHLHRNAMDTMTVEICLMNKIVIVFAWEASLAEIANALIQGEGVMVTKTATLTN